MYPWRTIARTSGRVASRCTENRRYCKLTTLMSLMNISSPLSAAIAEKISFWAQLVLRNNLDALLAYPNLAHGSFWQDWLTTLFGKI